MNRNNRIEVNLFCKEDLYSYGNETLLFKQGNTYTGIKSEDSFSIQGEDKVRYKSFPIEIFRKHFTVIKE